jgi:hypothetical protein
MKTLKINWIAVLICIVLTQIIPMVWYGMFFKTAWLTGNNLTEEMSMSNAGASSAYAAGLLGGAVMVYMLARIFVTMQVESVKRGLILGASIGFAFTLMPLMSQNFFSMRPYYLTWIDGGHYMLDLIVSGVILGGWRKYQS